MNARAMAAGSYCLAIGYFYGRLPELHMQNLMTVDGLTRQIGSQAFWSVLDA